VIYIGKCFVILLFVLLLFLVTFIYYFINYSLFNFKLINLVEHITSILINFDTHILKVYT